MNKNPYPESLEKDELRLIHLRTLFSYRKIIGRDLAYFGLPSAEMLDVKLWKPVLGHITAVERDHDVATDMYRTAQLIGVRNRMIILERSLVEVAKLMALDEKDFSLHASQLPLITLNNLRKIRSVPHDVYNLDFCGGFLYPKENGDSDNVDTLKNLIAFQSKHRHKFILITTLNWRDTGKDDYNGFIKNTLDNLKGLNIDVSDLEKFYLKPNAKQLTRLRFCIPTYIHKIAFDKFEVRSLGAWTYKTFYHTAMVFEPRQGKSALGLSWPPVEEFKDLLRIPLTQLTSENGKLIATDLSAPSLQ